MADRAQHSTVPGMVRWTRQIARSRFDNLCGRLAGELRMRAFLGEEEFDKFLEYVQTLKEPYVGAFLVPICCCGLKHTDLPCPYCHGFDACAPDSKKSQLGQLDFDHECPVATIAKVWRNNVERFPEPRAWNAGINSELLCHLLFGVADNQNVSTHGDIWKNNLHFRCNHTPGGEHAQCHSERAGPGKKELTDVMMRA